MFWPESSLSCYLHDSGDTTNQEVVRAALESLDVYQRFSNDGTSNMNNLSQIFIRNLGTSEVLCGGPLISRLSHP